MADSQIVYVRKCPAELVEVEFDVKQWQWHGMLLVPSVDAVNRFRNKLEYKIQI